MNGWRGIFIVISALLLLLSLLTVLMLPPSAEPEQAPPSAKTVPKHRMVKRSLQKRLKQAHVQHIPPSIQRDSARIHTVKPERKTHPHIQQEPDSERFRRIAMSAYSRASRNAHELYFDFDHDGHLNEAEHEQMRQAEQERSRLLGDWFKAYPPNRKLFTDIISAADQLSADLFSDYDFDADGNFNEEESQAMSEDIYADISSGYDDSMRFIDYLEEALSDRLGES